MSELFTGQNLKAYQVNVHFPLKMIRDLRKNKQTKRKLKISHNSKKKIKH